MYTPQSQKYTCLEAQIYSQIQKKKNTAIFMSAYHGRMNQDNIEQNSTQSYSLNKKQKERKKEWD